MCPKRGVCVVYSEKRKDVNQRTPVMSSNYTIKSSISESLLTPFQVEFIKKVHNRYFKASKLKRELFNYWDTYFPGNSKVDGKVIKSLKHYDDLKKRVIDCGSFTEYKVAIGSDKIQLVRANFCKKDKICSACAVNRAYRQHKKFLQSLEVYPYEYDDDLLGKHWYYIVTPVRHSREECFDVVYNRVDTLRKAVLMQMRDMRRGKSNGFWSQFNGGMGSIEITYNSNGWNVHINWLVNSDYKVQFYEFVDKNGKSWYQNKRLEAFLRRFNDSYIHSISELSFSNRDEIRDNLMEVLKYVLKFSNLEVHHLVYLYYYLYRKRLFFTFGNLRALDLESVDDVVIGDNIEDYEDFVNLIYRRLPNYTYEYLFCY